MEFKLPELGEGVHEGELVKWRVKAGETIKDDQPLCDVMTDKATVEIPSPFSGKVSALMAKEGETVKVGQTLCTYDGGGASASATASTSAASSPTKSTPAPAAAKPAAPAARSAPAPTTQSGATLAGDVSIATRVLASPSTRRLAREKGMDLGQISGSGPHGRVLREDLEKAPSGGTSTRRSVPAGGEKRIPFKGLRKKIAENMRLSKDNAAHFTFVEEADCTNLVRLRAEAKEIGQKEGVKVTYLPFIMKAMVAALRHYPMLNSTLDEETNEIVYKYYYNFSLSIQTEDGLTAPVLKGVEHKSPMEIAREIQDIVERARAKKLTREDFEGGTMTLTNAGSIGGLFTTPIINFPQVSILAFNKIAKKPVVKTIRGQDRIVIRDWTYFSISLDHRIVDGADAAEFMKLFIRYIENPSLLLLESF